MVSAVQRETPPVAAHIPEQHAHDHVAGNVFPSFLLCIHHEIYEGARNAKDLIAGAVGGVFVVLVGHPFDTVKVTFSIS